MKKDSANLDFLRATAVLAVLFAHLLCTSGLRELGPLQMVDLGRMGVLIFFVHTSLVLMMSMERLRVDPRRLFPVFYTRRFFRIYPLSILTVVATAVLHLPRAPWNPIYHWPGWYHFGSNLLLTQNLTFSDSVIGPLWSLPYEIQIYLVLPALYLLLLRWPPVKTVLMLWGASAGVAFFQRHYVARLDLMQYAPCFLGGVLAYALLPHASRRLPFWGWPVAIAACAALMCGRIEHAWVGCLLLGAAAPQFQDLRLTWLRAMGNLIARYSYGIYLSHIIVLWLAFVRMAYLPPPMRWMVFAALAVGLPVLLYHLVEQPMIHVGVALAANLQRRGGKQAERVQPQAV